MKTLITGALKISEEQILELEKLGLEIMYINDETKKIEIDVKDIEFVICNSLFLNNDIKEFTKLKYIQVTSAGLDRLPLEYIKQKGIKLFNARGVYSIPMAEWTILKILEIYKNSKIFYKNQENKIWEKDRNLLELSGKKVAILGYGSVGQEIAKRLKAFDTTITAVDIKSVEDDNIDNYFNISDIDKILPAEDIIIITLPLTDETRGLIDFDKISIMKKNAILINISRGNIIKEKDLVKALKDRKILGAVLDVFENEPLSKKSELWNLDNIIITPHNSFVSEQNERRMYKVILKNIIQDIIKN